MKILLIDDDKVSRQALTKLLSEKKTHPVVSVDSLQSGIEELENSSSQYSLVVCSYRGQSRKLLDLFLELSASMPAILFRNSAWQPEASGFFPGALFAIVERGDHDEFSKQLGTLQEKGIFSSKSAPDSDFIRISLTKLALHAPIAVDVYIRIGPNRYCKRFRKEDGVDGIDLEKYFGKPGIDYLYIRREESDLLLSSEERELNHLIKKTDAAEVNARDAAEDILEVIHDFTIQIGFTPQVAELAKKTVELTIKVLGGHPQLSEILDRVRVHEGRYVASHSMMVAEVACAIAYRVGWNSASTFLKLTLAAFLHDLSLETNRLARMERLEEVSEANGFTAAETQAFRFHPVRASQYAHRFSQVPPDVDTIVIQHHELPDGKGFPRGLYHHQINPLAGLFIIAHDLMKYSLEKGLSRPLLASFLEQSKERYSDGSFRKICESLASGVPIDL